MTSDSDGGLLVSFAAEPGGAEKKSNVRRQLFTKSVDEVVQ